MNGPHSTPLIALRLRSEHSQFHCSPLHPSPAQGRHGTSFIIAELYGNDHPDEWDFGIRKRQSYEPKIQICGMK